MQTGQLAHSLREPTVIDAMANFSARIIRCAGLIVVMALLPPGPAEAQTDAETVQTRAAILTQQREEKRGRLSPQRISAGEARMQKFETWRLPRAVFVKGKKGFRPVLGGMPSGSGFVVGGGYVYGLNSTAVEFTTNVRYSTLGYRQADARLAFPTSCSDFPLRAEIKAEYRDFKELNYFGLGPTTSLDDRAFYRIEDRTVGGSLMLETRFVDAGAIVNYWSGRIDSGVRGPSLEQAFDPTRTPGFFQQPNFLIYGGRAALKLVDRGFPPAGVTLLVEASRYDDRDTNAFDFTRVVGDVQAQIPLGYRNRILALRVRTSHSTADAGQEVPFYFLETIGGAKSLRGFREYRFRDTRSLLVNVEYRWEVWTYLDFGVFSDAGKVFSERDDFDFRDLETSYGFGMRIHTPANTVFRIDVARGQEGFKLHVGGGPTF